MYDYAYNDIKHCFGHNYEHQVNMENDKTSFRGLYTVQFEQCDIHGCGNVNVTWSDRTKQDIDMLIHDMFKYAIWAYALSHGFCDEFEVKGCTSARMMLENYQESVLFYTNNYLYSGERYHFCMVQFAELVCQECLDLCYVAYRINIIHYKTVQLEGNHSI